MPDAVHTIPFDALSNADLHVDAVYLAGTSGNINDDPLQRLLPVGNMGGFRHTGSPWKQTVKLSALYTSGAESDWPDSLDPQTGMLTYYGDNRSPGHELHTTKRGGNLLLRDAFEAAHGSPADRLRVPPFLLFERAAPGRAVRFRGLLAPGSATLTSDDELAAIWRSQGGSRFQNYRARFTVLDAATIPRSWINDLVQGADTTSGDCPEAWRDWVEGRAYKVLAAPSTTVVRKKSEQLPSDPAGIAMLRTIHQFFEGRPHAFEECAVAIWRLIAPATGRCDVTRPSRDGGRDAIGEYLLGPLADRVAVDFVLEAKCYAPTTSVGVRDVSRLVSRLRHRNFGVFVTLSYFNDQVYNEVREDGHPIAMICGQDVVDILREHGYGDANAVRAWLENQFTSGSAAVLV
ncbi:restriction endonuclease [Rhodococcus sp. ACS1]|uniref:restriction endonuclease n=1 Tax=Rhodococcus sp. ACS1 TaxID=2028570 RepID=UPI000BB156BC|nr:restriction endonuclease [Rhodococcus sp. ACS1]PBC39194.1 restriction endonuclease [Rhodococcus sp. ACS1]